MQIAASIHINAFALSPSNRLEGFITLILNPISTNAKNITVYITNFIQTNFGC